MSGCEDFEIGLCWGTLQNAGLLELIELAGRFGFPTLSLRPDTVLACVEEGTGTVALRKRLGDAGVRVRVMDALSDGLPGMEGRRPVSLAGKQLPPLNEENCFRAAEMVECPIVNVSLYGGQPVPLPRLAEAIGGIARRAAVRGLELALEFVPDTAMPDIQAAREIVETCGEPNCRVLLDPWHLARSGGTLEDVLAMPPGMIGAFQLDDRTPPAPGSAYVPMTGRDLPGEGELPLHEITRAALANNPELTAEIEVFSKELSAMTTEAAAARVAEALAVWRAAL